MKRWIAAVGAAAITFATIAIGAHGAQAAVSPPYVSISVSGDTCAPSATGLTGNPGSSFSILVDDGCQVNGYTVTPGVLTPDIFVKRGPGNVTIVLGALGSATLELVSFPNRAGATITNTSFSVTVTDEFVPEPIIHDYFQQVGVPASGDCADVPASAGHYPGFPIGGWSKSWAQWINDGKGGPVCTREVEQTATGEVILVG